MHPSLNLDDAQIWKHRDRQIYEALGRIFNLKQHGWLNIQSFQLNLPYRNEKEAIKLHNVLSSILPYLPAVAAASPIFDTKIGDYLDNRLHFYLTNQREVPSITGDIIPEQVNSLEEYEKTTVKHYSNDLCKLDAPKCLLNKKWLNSRGAVIRPDRKAIEVRILDEQECVKSDVALSCFIRAALRGMMADEPYPIVPHEILVQNLSHIMKSGLDAHVLHPKGSTAKQVCRHLLEIACGSANWEEKKYLPLIKQRIENGNLSQMILRDITKKTRKMDIEEAIFDLYSSLANCLSNNRVYV
jgi:gamma-glutamyl:cysteine ligase YbdK (ATP-grasp superfamily)